jgi:hypothetical protein
MRCTYPGYGAGFDAVTLQKPVIAFNPDGFVAGWLGVRLQLFFPETSSCRNPPDLLHVH